MLRDTFNKNDFILNLLYLPSFAEYQPHDPAQAGNWLGPTELETYLASQFGKVDGVKAALADIRVVPVVESSLGFAVPVHDLIPDISGAEFVV